VYCTEITICFDCRRSSLFFSKLFFFFCGSEMADSFICANDLRKGHYLVVDEKKLGKVKEISRSKVCPWFFFFFFFFC
jgi:hypothetical protein